MLFRLASSADPLQKVLQKESDLDFWQATCVQNFRILYNLIYLFIFPTLEIDPVLPSATIAFPAVSASWLVGLEDL